jgi:hypothetical protein
MAMKEKIAKENEILVIKIFPKDLFPLENLSKFIKLLK